MALLLAGLVVASAVSAAVDVAFDKMAEGAAAVENAVVSTKRSIKERYWRWSQPTVGKEKSKAREKFINQTL
jgi:hypothetical protein